MDCQKNTARVQKMSDKKYVKKKISHCRISSQVS